MAMPLTGGVAQPVGYPASISRGMSIAMNLRTGLVTYVHLRRMDADIGWLRVMRK